MKSLKRCLILGLLACNLASCDDTYNSSIPDYPVYIEINLDTAPYTILRSSPLKYFTFEFGQAGRPVNEQPGYGGIFVCTGYDGTIYAFDMACPVEANSKIKIRPLLVNGDFIGEVICDKCGSVYELGNGIGHPSAGPAKETLRRYKVNRSQNRIIITR